MTFLYTLATAGAALFLTAAIVLVDSCPCPALGFLLGNPTLLVAFGNVVGFAFLLFCVFRFVASWHGHFSF